SPPTRQARWHPGDSSLDFSSVLIASLTGQRTVCWCGRASPYPPVPDGVNAKIPGIPASRGKQPHALARDRETFLREVPIGWPVPSLSEQRHRRALGTRAVVRCERALRFWHAAGRHPGEGIAGIGYELAV